MTNASERAYHAIRKLILDGILAPGAQLTEEEVAAHCSMSRTPVREAIRRLEGEKIIGRERGRTFVKEWSDEKMLEIFSLRSLLEGHVAERAALRSTKDQINKLKYFHKILQYETEKPRPDVREFVRINTRFHKTLLDAADFEMLETIVEITTNVPIVHNTLDKYDRQRLRESVFDHAALIEAIELKDPERAKAIAQAHVLRAKSVLLLSKKPIS
ncbi:GntR family transcriptional regulator [Novosphingobium sp. 11B]